MYVPPRWCARDAQIECKRTGMFYNTNVKFNAWRSLQLDAGYSQSVTSVIHSFLEQWRLSNCDSFHMLYMFSGLACAWDIWIAVLVSRKCMFNKVTILSHIHACMVLVWHIFACRVLSYGTIFLLPDIFLSKKYVFATDFIVLPIKSWTRRKVLYKPFSR